MVDHQSLGDKSILAEKVFLGALMHNASLLNDVSNLNETTFISKRHRLIFAEIDRRIKGNEDVDVFLVAERLERIDPGFNWLTYIGDMMFHTPSSSNAKHYAAIVVSHAKDREMAAANEKISLALLNPNIGHVERLSIADEVIRGIDVEPEKQHTFTISNAMSLSINSIEKAYASDNKEPEFPYGFVNLDEITCGAHRGDLIYIAGRPSMGKTAFAMRVAESFCEKGKSGLVFSMEMSAEQLAGRMICSIGRIDANRYRKGDLADDDWDRLSYTLAKIGKYNLHIDETSAMTPSDMLRAAKKVSRSENGLDFIVVDYLQLMSSTGGRKNGTRTEDVTELSRQMKNMARELNVPVIVLSQLNRNLESRTNKRPVMSDMRESGALEQDADLILFLYRDEVYNSDSKEKGLAEIIIGKHRNGALGTVGCAFIGHHARFEDVAGSRGY